MDSVVFCIFYALLNYMMLFLSFVCPLLRSVSGVSMAGFFFCCLKQILRRISRMFVNIYKKYQNILCRTNVRFLAFIHVNHDIMDLKHMDL